MRWIEALLGPSGSGKTTLLNVIGCIIAPSSVKVTPDDDVVYDNRRLHRDLRKLRLHKIGFIFQLHNLLPFPDARDNVALVLKMAGKSTTEAQRRAIGLLEYLEVGPPQGCDAGPSVGVGRGTGRRHRPRAGQQPAHHSGG